MTVAIPVVLLYSNFVLSTVSPTPVSVPKERLVTVAPIPVSDGFRIVEPIDTTSSALLVEIPVISYSLLYSFLSNDDIFSILTVSPTLFRISSTVTVAFTKGVNVVVPLIVRTSPTR